MRDGRQPALDLGEGLRDVTGPDAAARGARDVVLGREAVEQLLHRRRERVAGRVHAREHRVAAVARDLDGAQDRAEGGALRVGVVGVPVVGAVAAGRDLVEHVDLGIVVVLRLEGRDLDRAEMPREGDVVRLRQVLVAEEEHEVGVERVAERFDGLVREGLRQIDAADLGADLRRDGEDLDRHRSPSRRAQESSSQALFVCW